MTKLLAEFLGTSMLVFVGVGSAVFGIQQIGVVGVALAFGFALLMLAYAIGPISGCHVNPAVTLGVLLTRRIAAREAAGYWVAQVLGAIIGAALIKGLIEFGGVKDQTGALGTNSWGATVSGTGAFVVEVVLTFLLVFVVLLVTNRSASVGFGGLAIGLSLVVPHLVAIPLDGTSVNPARSIGPALFAGTNALAQLWLFIVAPLLGGAVAAVVASILAVTEVTEVQEPGLGAYGEPVQVSRSPVPARELDHHGMANAGRRGEKRERDPHLGV